MSDSDLLALLNQGGGGAQSKSGNGQLKKLAAGSNGFALPSIEAGGRLRLSVSAPCAEWHCAVCGHARVARVTMRATTCSASHHLCLFARRRFLPPV